MLFRLNLVRWGCLAALFAFLLPLSAAAELQCGAFSIIPTPDPGSSSNALVDIAAVGDGTAWAIGSQSSGSTTGMFLYYDGSQWNEVSMPAEVEGVAFGPVGNTPEGDVWFAGTRAYSVYEVEVFFLRARDGAIDRVDSILNPGAPVGISATASDDVWAVSGGIWPVDEGGNAFHFDGSNWETTVLPATFIYKNRPQGIYAAGPDDVWIAGYGGDGRAQYFGYVQHWDGSSWETVPTPFGGQDQVFFLSIDGSSSNDIWIAGHVNYAQDLLLHWDGSTWMQVAGPASGAALSQVTVPGPDQAWVTPYSLDPGSAFYYWNGSSWTEGATFDIPGAITVNWRGLSGGGSCDVWAAGSYHDGTTHHTLAARLVPGEVEALGIFVDAITMTRTYLRGKRNEGVATVAITDTDLVPGAGALVTGHFSGPTSETLSATTDGNGTATFTSAPVKRPKGSWCFSVDDVSADGASYDPGLNTVTSACEVNDAGGGGGHGKPTASVVSVYPSPFNPLTTFSFALDSDQVVSLAVYDVSGRRVAVLVDDSLHAGEHKVPWNAEGHPSGVYLYRLTTSEVIRTGRITLTK